MDCSLVRGSTANSGGVCRRRGVLISLPSTRLFSSRSGQPDVASVYRLPARQAPSLRHHLHAGVQPPAEQTLLRLRACRPRDALLPLPRQCVSSPLFCLVHCLLPTPLCFFGLSTLPAYLPTHPLLYPFVLIQDMATGDSGSFKGR